MSKVKNFEIVTQLSYLSEADLIKALNKIDAETKKNHIQDYAYILHDKILWNIKTFSNVTEIIWVIHSN